MMMMIMIMMMMIIIIIIIISNVDVKRYTVLLAPICFWRAAQDCVTN